MDEEGRRSYLGFLESRRERIIRLIAEAAARAGRDAGEVTLLALSKTVGVEEVALAWEAGYRAFGENRPQELGRKLQGVAALPQMAGVRFDMIGNLQTNKINQVIGRVELVHSISSPHLAEAVSRRSEARGIVTRALVEVNVSGEESKSGLSPDDARASLDDLLALPGISLEGLMTMAPANDADAARRAFSGLRELRDDLRLRSGRELAVLSCGMSDDFQIAVEEGSTLVRLGRTVFDPSHEPALATS